MTYSEINSCKLETMRNLNDVTYLCNTFLICAPGQGISILSRWPDGWLLAGSVPSHHHWDAGQSKLTYLTVAQRPTCDGYPLCRLFVLHWQETPWTFICVFRSVSFLSFAFLFTLCFHSSHQTTEWFAGKSHGQGQLRFKNRPSAYKVLIIKYDSRQLT